MISSKPQQTITFNSLPLEIREEIWAATLTPRLIYIHPHQRLSPPHWDGKYLDDGMRITQSVRFNFSTHAPHETPATAFKAYSEFALGRVQNGERVRFCDLMEREMNPVEKAHLHATRPLEWWKEPRSGKPPPALYICRESRAVALRNGYEIAFKGWLANKDGEREHEWQKYLEGEDLEFWERNALSKKGIWVNFERDVFMFDALLRDGRYLMWSQQNPLALLRRYARKDTQRIQGLALGAIYRTMGVILRGQAIEHPSQEGSWKWQLPGFDSLTDIWMDDEFEAEEIGHEEYYKNAVRMPRVASYPVPTFKIRDAKDARRDFWVKMQHIRPSHFEGWQAVLPEIRVVRGLGWNEYF
jgi:hypothetical protein